jgi:lysophospholipase L1-like esterase
MLRNLLIFIFVSISAFTKAQEVSFRIFEFSKYCNRDHYLIEGTAFSDSSKENPFNRLPLFCKEKLEKDVWSLSQESAGISIRFTSNTTKIIVAWTLYNEVNQYDKYNMNQMAFTGVMGMDLYYKNGNNWQFLNTARANNMDNRFLLINNMTAEMREYKLYLPLYYGVTKLEIGIDYAASIEKPKSNHSQPVVFFGSSITQGCSASRPGMAYPSIISRKLDVDCVNLGFTGYGKMEGNMAEIMSEIDASCYVIECIPNISVKEIHDNARPLVETIRKKHPTTPIVFVDGMNNEESSLDDSTQKATLDKNHALKSEYKKMLEKGYSNIFYVESKDALGSDHEATVDGVHFTDLGSMRYADFLIEKFKKFHLKIVPGNKK